MLKGALQRHAQLGRVARRQLSSMVPAIRAQTRVPTPTSLRLAFQTRPQLCVGHRASSRFYSGESAAHRDHSSQDSPGATQGLITKFADLSSLGVDPALIDVITKGMKYETMTDVQALTINPALNGVDLVAQAKTGTGKTLAFLVPVVQRLLAADPALARRRSTERGFSREPPRYAGAEDIRAVILSPTRELAEQIGVEARALVKSTGIVVQTAVGGTRKREALDRMHQQGCHILVATPGRLYDILQDPSARVAAPRLQAVVLDEADRMLDVGFSEAIRDILRQFPDIRDVDRQTLLFSATIPRNVISLAKSMVKTDNFEFVQTIPEDESMTHENVPQNVVSCSGYENFLPTVLEIAQKAMAHADNDPNALPFKAVLFFSNTAMVQFASSVLRGTSMLRGNKGVPLFEIHSKLTQPARTRAAESFRRARTGILVSSDVTARGMDFPNVSHVIQIGLPPDRDQYIHRVGRTGRAGKDGEGWLLITDAELAEARDRLTDLPLKPNNSLEAARHDVGTRDPPPSVQRYFTDVKEAYSQASRFDFNQVYSSVLGQRLGRRLRVDDVVELLNNWALKGLGWEEPPAVSHSMASKRGLLRVPGIRIGHDEDDRYNDEGRRGNPFGDRGGSFGGRGGSFGGRGSSFGGRGDSFGDRRGSFGGRGFDRKDGDRQSFGDRGRRSSSF